MNLELGTGVVCICQNCGFEELTGGEVRLDQFLQFLPEPQILNPVNKKCSETQLNDSG